MALVVGLPLFENGAEGDMRKVSMHNKRPVRFGHRQDGFGHEIVAELVKSGLAKGGPDPLHVFLEKNCERACKFGIAANKFAIIPGKPKKTPKLGTGLGRHESFNSTHLFRVGL